MARRSLGKRIGYYWLRALSQLGGVFLFRVQCIDRDLIPDAGGLLVCSNHQSFFDPVLVGIWFTRRMNYLARKTLFKFPPFRWLIEFLDAIPIDRDGFGLEGIKETLRRLKRGEIVLIFPEGTRTSDGRCRKLKPGFVALARRGKTPILPIGIDGAYDSWPRKARLPTPTKVCVCVGELISMEQMKGMSDDELVAELQIRIEDCHQRARRLRLQ